MKTDYEKLARNLIYERKNGYHSMSEKWIDDAFDFCEGYKEFLDNSKTERESVKTSLEVAKKAGFEEWSSKKSYKSGDKVYYVNRNKAIILAKIGSAPIEDGVNISVAHIDSPRIDIKQNPLYEASNIAYFDTHYYGGIKKFQWVTVPLALHGTIIKANGESLNIVIGEDSKDPVFYITDILPHLDRTQAEKNMRTGIPGESLDIIIGTRPVADEKISNAVKLYSLKLINEKYGITDADFMSAELTLVPAGQARDIGFDRSLIASYGHDDRVCAYPSLQAILDCGDVEHTAIVCLTDKEEIGSVGNTGLDGNYLFDFIKDLAISAGANPREVFRNSKCLSADVNAAYDPTFSDVFEKNNCSYINCGLVVTKYTGSGGKSGSSDASAEFVWQVRNIFDNSEVVWQMGELGKVDAGGGGTVSKFVAKYNIDVVDIGVPVLSMHAPAEAVSKLDVYSTYKGILAFFEKMK